jgi:dipeptidyl aminopeptidase/acylaminoacyl peptidase
MIDGLGTPLRGRAFHDVSYANLSNAGGIEDHVGALREIAACRPYMDFSRVGIYGISAGGYAAARAVLAYPDVFKAAVAIAGNHDVRRDKARWVERYQGLLTDETAEAYARQSNSGLAERLTGRLLLIHGELDENVHPALTLQLAHALIAANKDFDLLLLPGARHDVRDNPYVIRRVWDYFVTHLLSESPPAGHRIRSPAAPGGVRGITRSLTQNGGDAL